MVQPTPCCCLGLTWGWGEKGKILMEGSHSHLSVPGSPLFTPVRDSSAEVGKVALPEHGWWVEETGRETPVFPLPPSTFHSSGV